MPGVAGRLLDQVEQDPARRPDQAGGDPGHARDRWRPAGHRGRAGRVTIFSVCRATSAENDTTSARVSPSTSRNPSAQSYSGRKTDDVPILDEADPGLLDQGGVLDQPAQAELAHAGAGHGLRVGQAVGGVADAVTLLAR